MKISIVTVTFNSEKTISHTINSVLSQTYPDIEYIIVDGNSTDNTVALLKSYESLFKGRMHWISEDDSGIYDAMNKGIKIASGEYIGILNSDDFFTSPYVISNLACLLQEQTYDAIYGDVHFVNDKNLSKTVRYYSSSFFKRYLMRIGLMPAHPSFYVKSSIFKRFGYYKVNYKIAADFEFMLRTIYKGRIKIKYLPQDMVTMRLGGVSTSGIAARRLIMREHLRAFKENGIYTNVFLLSLRYIYKIYEVFTSPLRK